MQWIECDECENWRRIDNVWTPAGWVQPPCYSCGAPGWLEDLETGAPIEFYERITGTNFFEENQVHDGRSTSDM